MKLNLRALAGRVTSSIHIIMLRKLGMTIGKNCRVSRKAMLDKTYPKGVHIGDGSRVLAEVIILCHDRSRSLHLDTTIGDNCILGIRSMIMPGVTLGNSVLVAAGSVVTKSFPSNVLIAGNPAKIIREGIVIENAHWVNKDEYSHNYKK